jgi:hypothetical protein
MDPTEGYYYKVYWDVRMPQNAVEPAVRNSSYLRLYHTAGNIFNYSDASLDPRWSGRHETNPAFSDGLVA